MELIRIRFMLVVLKFIVAQPVSPLIVKEARYVIRSIRQMYQGVE